MKFQLDRTEINKLRRRTVILIIAILTLTILASLFVYPILVKPEFIARAYDSAKLFILILAAAIPFIIYLLLLLWRRFIQYLQKAVLMDQGATFTMDLDYNFRYKTADYNFDFKLTDIMAVENFYFTTNLSMHPFYGKGFIIIYLKNNNKLFLSSLIFKETSGFCVVRNIFKDKPIRYSEKKLNWIKKMEE